MLPQPHSSRRRLLQQATVALAMAVALAVAAYFGAMSSNAAPDVAFTSLTGQKLTLRALRGKVVMVNFWATSCSFCVHEMPQMAATYNQYKDRGLDVVAVAMSYDPPNSVLNYAQTRHLPFTVALDLQGELAHAFGGVDTTPTTIVIGKDGNIIERFRGEPDFTVLHYILEHALAASA
ncbi:MAG TPA: TlpA disulfide reductase family protein [Burkholderiaceae bacterium]|nr:TlpA disulfide reductase family protein [Burkholderiaceae bacterium]